MSELKPGWYWCKFREDLEWEANFWDGEEWTGIAYTIIGPRIPSPDEPWVTVPVEPTEVMKNEADYNTPGPMTAWKCWQVMLSVAPSPGDES